MSAPIRRVSLDSRHAPDPQPHTLDMCGTCKVCHPGRGFGGDSFCHALRAGKGCRCHKVVN